MIESRGDCDIHSINDANIPVNIYIHAPDDESNIFSGKWVLQACNYMPRKGVVSEQAYCFIADTREELSKFIGGYILPLYSTAVDVLEQMVSGKSSHLDYWSLPDAN